MILNALSKIIVYAQLDGSTRITYINGTPGEVFSLLTGAVPFPFYDENALSLLAKIGDSRDLDAEKTLQRLRWVEAEIARRIVPHPHPDSARAKFLTKAEVQTRPIVEAIAAGVSTEDEAINLIALFDSFPGDTWRVTDISNIPADRTFRDAWTDKNETETVDVDMEKARQIKLNWLREQRKKQLVVLDVEYQRADEAGSDDAKKSVTVKKQALRDMPISAGLEMAAIDNPEILKEYLPDCFEKVKDDA